MAKDHGWADEVRDALLLKPLEVRRAPPLAGRREVLTLKISSLALPCSHTTWTTYELEAPEHAKELRLPFERQAADGGLR